MSYIRQLDASLDALTIIATPEIEDAAERFVGMLQTTLDAEASGNQAEHDKCMSELFRAHMQFTDAVRKHFNRPRKVYVAVPMIDVPEHKPRSKGKGGKARWTLKRQDRERPA